MDVAAVDESGHIVGSMCDRKGQQSINMKRKIFVYVGRLNVNERFG